MDTVTEHRLAVSLTQEGSIGIVHKNLPIEGQAREVEKVKRAESEIIRDPKTLSPGDTIDAARRMMQECNISGIPIVRDKKIVGILTMLDLGVHVLLETCVPDILRDEDILWKYKEAGVLFIYMGVEAGHAQRLETFKKEIKFEQSREAIRLVKSHDMITESSLIIGMPDETPDSIKETLDLALLYDPDYMHFLFITPWPYADLYRDLEPHIEIRDYSKYNLVEPVIKPRAMTREQLFKEGLSCYRNYYMRKVQEWRWSQMGDLKRQCLIRGMKAIMEHSFLKNHMKGLGGMPKHVHDLLINVLRSSGAGVSPHAGR